MARDLLAIEVVGLAEILAAAKQAGKDVDKLLRADLREAVRPVLVETVRLVAEVDADSAVGWGTAIRKTGIVRLEQRRPRTTGKHPEFGRLQKRRAVKAFETTRPLVNRNVQRELDEIAIKFPGPM